MFERDYVLSLFSVCVVCVYVFVLHLGVLHLGVLTYNVTSTDVASPVVVPGGLAILARVKTGAVHGVMTNVHLNYTMLYNSRLLW